MTDERRKASDFPQEVLTLFDRYVHGMIDRRAFLDGAGKFAVGGATAMSMLKALQPRYAWAQQVPADDARISVEYVEYPSPNGSGTMRGYMARPTGAEAPYPAVLVIHENRGLNPYIEDVVRRFGAAGFLSLGPDALTPLGGYPGNDDEGRSMQGQLDRATMTEDFVAGAEFLMSHPESTGRVGAVGFCFGGAMVNARVNASWPDYQAALDAAGKQYTMHMYPGVGHGFHNDTTPRYDEAAATLAQERTIAFFNEHLR